MQVLNLIGQLNEKWRVPLISPGHGRPGVCVSPMCVYCFPFMAGARSPMEKLIKCGQAGLCAFTAEVVAQRRYVGAFTAEVVAQRRYVGAFTAVAAAVVHAGGRDRFGRWLALIQPSHDTFSH